MTQKEILTELQKIQLDNMDKNIEVHVNVNNLSEESAIWFTRMLEGEVKYTVFYSFDTEEQQAGKMKQVYKIVEEL